MRHIASAGASPRFFLLLEEIDRLILVNEQAGNLVAFAIDDHGRLSPTGHTVEVAGAAFLTTDSPLAGWASPRWKRVPGKRP